MGIFTDIADATRRMLGGAPAPVADLGRRPSELVAVENPLPGFGTIPYAQVRSILDQHELGQFRQSAVLAEAMGRNPRIHAALDTRVLGVTGLPRRVEPGTGDGRRTDTIAREWDQMHADVCPPGTLAELLRKAVTCGFAVGELLWTRRDGDWIPTLVPWETAWVYWRHDTRSFWALPLSSQPVEIVPGGGQWVVFAYARHRPWMRGVVRCLAIEDALRALAVRDWARWCEVHGLPIKGYKVPKAELTSALVQQALANLRHLQSEGLIYLPKGKDDATSFELELLQANGRGYQGFMEFMAAVDSDVAIAILGQNLTTEIHGGSYSAAQVHKEVKGDLITADAAMLGATLHRQVAVPWAVYNHGSADLAPVDVWDASPPEDWQTIVQSFSPAARAVDDCNRVLRSYQSQRSVDAEALFEGLGVPLRDAPPPEPAPLPLVTRKGPPPDAPEEEDEAA